MSKDVYESDRMTLTQHWNGEERALRVNIRGMAGFIDLTKDSATELIMELTRWVKSA